MWWAAIRGYSGPATHERGRHAAGRPAAWRRLIFSSQAGEKLQVFLLLQKNFINRSTAAPDRADVPCFQCIFTQSHSIRKASLDLYICTK
jgi:hypothetical protein